jgi:hypothetical protein
MPQRRFAWRRADLAIAHDLKSDQADPPWQKAYRMKLRGNISLEQRYSGETAKAVTPGRMLP